MGNQKSKLKTEELEEIFNLTEFTEEEIKKWHKSFVSACPSTKLTKEVFIRQCSSFVSGDATEYAERAFRRFDSDGNGFLDFREFMCALSLTSRGTFEQRIKWTFSLYDLDGDGHITKDEMQDMITALYKMIGDQLIYTAVSSQLTAVQITEKVFTIIDLNGDEKISLEEFKTAAIHDPTVILLFAT